MLDRAGEPFHFVQMLPLEEARRLIAEHLHMLPAERVALAESMGRILRAPLVAEEDLPGFDRSAFDGYAVRAKGTPAKCRVAFEVAAGSGVKTTLAEGECARIFTGAPMPDGADAVAMQENCTREGEMVSIPEMEAGSGVRVRGEDARAGAVLVPAGVKLGAIDVSLHAQLGQVNPLVASKPRVYHVRTGDEIVSPEVTPGPGQIRDSNSSLIRALVEESGCSLVAQRAAGDSIESLVNACAAADTCDLLLISGGASVGDYDFGKAALTELGFSIRFSAMNLRPGKPLVFATRGKKAAFVIPGNPLSHFVCWHVVMRTAVDVLISGLAELELSELRLGGSRDLKGNPRETWWPARVVIRDGTAWAEPLKWQSSGDLTSLSGIGALIRIASGSAGVAAGSTLPALLLR
jgi:molybdopterin molybdotransferase